MNSVEAELLSTVKYVKETMDGHIKSDEIMFKELVNKLHLMDNSISNLVVLSTETLKSQMALTSEAQKMLYKHNEFLFGDSNGNKGVSIRVDRLEGIEEAHRWTFRAMWGALITLIGKVFYDIMSNK